MLDNVDDAGFLLEAQAASSKTAARPLREYLPHCELGSILITTRNKDAALELVEGRDIFVVEPMNEVQAVALLEKKLGAQGDNGDVAELAAMLEYMPLAIVQAAAYILRRAPRCSVAEYLREFGRSDGEKTSLLNHEAGNLRRDREAKNSIIITWQISFDHLRQRQASAADLLSLMSFFDRQGIPETLLYGGRGIERASTASDERKWSIWQRLQAFFSCTESRPETQQERREGAGDRVNFENDVVALRDLCLISIGTDSAIFEMHSLVQLAIRTWLTTNGKLERWKQQFISNLCAEFPTGNYENWVACQALFAHAKAAVNHKPEATSSLIEWATLLYHAAWYAESKGSAIEAEMLAIQSMKVRKKVLGQEHEDTIWSVAMVADVYALGGRWDEAEKLRRQVVEMRKTKLGADHPRTLTSMGNLALTYWNQGRWDDAEKLQVQVIEMSKTKLRADHPDTLTNMANLASTYRNQGRWDDAEKLQVQVMETRKTKLGADHPETLTSMGNLASTYWDQGRWGDAEKLEVQVMETRKTKLGADHPSTLTSMGNLAFTWKSLGRSVEAIQLMQQCVQRREDVLKASHPDSMSSRSVLNQWKEEQADVESCDKLKTMRM